MQLIADSQVTRRRITLRTTLLALMAAPLLMAAWSTVVPAHAEETPFISVVTGLAPDDLLNIRAKPSAIGKTEARLAAGANVRNLGCNDIDGHPWCKVQSDNPKAIGWTPVVHLYQPGLGQDRKFDGIECKPAVIRVGKQRAQTNFPAFERRESGIHIH